MTACFKPSTQHSRRVPRSLKFKNSAEIQYFIYTCYGLILKKTTGIICL